MQKEAGLYKAILDAVLELLPAVPSVEKVLDFQRVGGPSGGASLPHQSDAGSTAWVQAVHSKFCIKHNKCNTSYL